MSLKLPTRPSAHRNKHGMFDWITARRSGAIGVDVGSRSVKLLQFNAAHSGVIESARWDLPAEAAGDADKRERQLVEALVQARSGRHFRGRDAVVCLTNRELFVQNIRVPKVPGDELARQVVKEAQGRLPFPPDRAELRFLEAADVRQGDAVLREVIVLACDREVLERTLGVIEEAGLRPVSVDVEPAALVRCYSAQYRRDEDRQTRRMYVNVGTEKSLVVIARGSETLFVKYIDVGGRHFDEAVARKLRIEVADASALRRHNGDRRADQQDAEVRKTITGATRPVVEQLAGELSMCVRYHNVTFRGQPIVSLVLGGGEATGNLLDALSARVDLRCELGDPLRQWRTQGLGTRKGQWDVAAGLALREVN